MTIAGYAGENNKDAGKQAHHTFELPRATRLGRAAAFETVVAIIPVVPASKTDVQETGGLLACLSRFSLSCCEHCLPHVLFALRIKRFSRSANIAQFFVLT